MKDRREFLKLSVAGALVLPEASAHSFIKPFAQADVWAQVPRILRRIKPPVFPKRDFNLTRFGAVAGGDCTEAFRNAIAACHKAGGRRVNVPSENIVIRGCQMKDGHGGVTIGSEISGGVRNVFVENCRMDSPHLERALRLKTNSVRGGVLENIHLRNIQIGQVSDAIVSVDFTYEEGDAGKFMPTVRNISVCDVKSAKSNYALYLRGFERAPIAGIRLKSSLT